MARKVNLICRRFSFRIRRRLFHHAGSCKRAASGAENCTLSGQTQGSSTPQSHAACMPSVAAAAPRTCAMAVQEEGMVGRVGAREMEFLAEETILEIEARFRHPAFKFIRGTFGPFEPNQRSQVPLWLALALKKRKRCRIVLPEWLDNDYLTEVLRRERMTADTFEELDYHFIEIANLLLKTAADEFVQPDRTKSLIEDIENVRMEKIRRGLRNISDTVLKGSSVMAVKMNNVGAMEITTVRDFLTEAMNMFYELSGQQDQGRGGGGRPMAVPNPAPAVGPNGPNKRLRRYRALVT